MEEQFKLELNNELLPLGSIVQLVGNMKKLVIISRASVIEDEYFEYGAVMYPEGMLDDNIAYFNSSDIANVVFTGFSDEDESLMTKQIIEAKTIYFNQELSALDEQSEESTTEEDPFYGLRDEESGV
ncbi:MAG: DUF4176 domain-containing protein [Lactobacillaceae bacterium]|jgi:hypothetical protein|nr:DUF4176 domain-containing protein [Lactobacillaceae bacterium]